MTVQRMRKIYGMVNDKYKTVRERRKNVEHSDDQTGAETIESQRLFQKTIKEKSKFIRGTTKNLDFRQNTCKDAISGAYHFYENRLLRRRFPATLTSHHYQVA